MVPNSLADDFAAQGVTVNSAFSGAEESALAAALSNSPRHVLDVLPAAVYMTDADGQIIYYNEPAAQLWGYHPKIGETSFCGSWKLYHPDGTPMPHDECPMALTLKAGLAVKDVEAILERPDGTRIPFIPFPAPVWNADGSLAGAVNMLVDITERKRAERDAQLLAAIVESSDDAIVSKDLKGVITSWNRGAERIFGYAADEAIGKSIAILIPIGRQDEEPGILDRIKCGDRVDHYETVRERKDGSLIDISLTVSPVRDANGKVIGASKIARDITERKEVQLRQQMLTQEIHHRTKNLFAVVQAVVSRSFADKANVKEAVTAILSRLRSLAQTHVLLVDKDWKGADLKAVVRAEMEPYKDRVTIEGPSILLNSQAAQNFALAVHELATNAAKYGALSSPGGRVVIGWQVTKPNGHRQFTFNWRESGGPQVFAPARRGFGSAVLEQVMSQYFEGPIVAFPSGGVRYELSGSVDSIV